MKAQVEEMRARVVEAEAEVPRAIAAALREGRIGAMDYFTMRNVMADTEMRESVAKEGGQDEESETRGGGSLMDRLFATLFTLYIAGTIVSWAIIRKMRTEPGPSLPPIHVPTLFRGPLRPRSSLTPPGEPHAPRVRGAPSVEAEAQPSLPPGDELTLYP